LAAGSTPIVSFAFTQGPNELNVRSAELLISAGRLDLSNLTPGKTLGTASVKIPNSTLPEIPVSHVIVSNDGSNVRSEFRGSAYGQVVPIAEGLFQNTGSNGIRILITIKDKVQVLGTNVNLFPDGSTTGSNPLSVPFAVGDVFILPTPAGTPFTAITNFTSVNFPASGGTPSYQQRSQPFTAQ
jgi:hypothetical protein